jgi:hypothetical protein
VPVKPPELTAEQWLAAPRQQRSAGGAGGSGGGKASSTPGRTGGGATDGGDAGSVGGVGRSGGDEAGSIPGGTGGTDSGRMDGIVGVARMEAAHTMAAWQGRTEGDKEFTLQLRVPQKLHLLLPPLGPFGWS